MQGMHEMFSRTPTKSIQAAREYGLSFLLCKTSLNGMSENCIAVTLCHIYKEFGGVMGDLCLA